MDITKINTGNIQSANHNRITQPYSLFVGVDDLHIVITAVGVYIVDCQSVCFAEINTTAVRYRVEQCSYFRIDLRSISPDCRGRVHIQIVRRNFLTVIAVRYRACRDKHNRIRRRNRVNLDVIPCQSDHPAEAGCRYVLGDYAGRIGNKHITINSTLDIS